MNNYQMCQREFMKLQSLHYSPTGEVHECLWFNQYKSVVAIIPFASKAGEGFFSDRNAFLVGQAIQKKETRIVAGPLILGAGITQPRYDKRAHGILLVRPQQQLHLLWPGRERLRQEFSGYPAL
jgi:hypothetical protein